MPYDPPPELTGLSLEEIAEAVEARRLPPVSEWSPAETGDSHMEIRADGSWWHEGSKITRPAMVRAFASLLMRDDAGQHWLVTPQQKLRVQVEDAALIAVDCVERDGALAFRLNTDDIVIGDSADFMRVSGTDDAPNVQIHARNGCMARLDRSTWLQLVEIALHQGDGASVKSAGHRVSLLPG